MGDEKEKEIFENFLVESAELLAEVERDVIVLENNPSNRETIDNIFRCVHSIKGNSGLFGLSGIKLFAHTLENMLGRIRDRELDADTNVIGVILKGADLLNSIFSRLNTDPESSNLNKEEEEYIDKVTTLLESGGIEESNEKLRIELLKFINRPETQEELDNNPLLSEIIETIKNASPDLLKDKRITTGDPVSCFGIDVSREYYAIKTILGEVEQEIHSEKQVSVVLDSIGMLIEKHEENKNQEPVEIFNELNEEIEMMYHDETGFDEIIAELTSDAMAKYEKHIKKKEKKRLETRLNKGERGATPLSRQIKVDQAKLDKALNTVGELVTISEFFNYLLTQFNEGKVDKNLNSLKDAIISLHELNESLSHDLYDIRKVPIKEAFQKLPRVARDTMISVGKKARLVIEGEETMVDKSLVAKLETMLVHMIRNSIDHGLETPDERLDAGKPSEGCISLSVKGDNTWIVITLADDGRGIDLEKLKEKALKRGVIDEQEAETISEQNMAEKIFSPGFSTAEKVTETSGRGVGMDIVASYASEMGGSVRLDNRPGKGISFILTIPVTQTTLVKRGLAVSVGGNAFLIPIEMVLESFRPSNGEIQTIEGKAEIVQRRGEIMGLIRLHELFGIKTDVKKPAEALLVMVRHKNKKACFMVDFVIGQRQIIYKNLYIKTKRQPSPFEGVSVYDGSRLAIILDINGIITQVEKY